MNNQITVTYIHNAFLCSSGTKSSKVNDNIAILLYFLLFLLLLFGSLVINEIYFISSHN